MCLEECNDYSGTKVVIFLSYAHEYMIQDTTPILEDRGSKLVQNMNGDLRDCEVD